MERLDDQGPLEAGLTRLSTPLSMPLSTEDPVPDREPVIRPGCQVRLHLSLQLSDGTRVLSTFEEDPLEISLGDGTLTPGTEHLLLGRSAGSEGALLAKGEDLFGPWSADKVHWLAASAFPQAVPPVGSLLAFDLPGSAETLGLIREIHEDQVKVDFNHPLSRNLLWVRFQILAIADACQEGDQPRLSSL